MYVHTCLCMLAHARARSEHVNVAFSCSERARAHSSARMLEHARARSSVRYIRMYTYEHIIYECIHTDICIYIFIHIYMFERARACAIYECIHMYVCIFRNICKYICIHGYVYISMCASIYTIYMRKYVYIHTYTHAQARSSMH